MEKFNELKEEIQKHLDCTYQNWFFGAGISYQANIPLMIPLTKKIKEIIIETEDKKIFLEIEKNLPDGSHIEHYLSHIGDLLALIDRSKKESIKIDDYEYTAGNLDKLYKSIVLNIEQIMRYGLKDNKVGDFNNPIIEIIYHRDFLKKLFYSRSNLENRTCINFFTINYDTLLEDALVLEKKDVIDGFKGSAMGFWNPEEFIEKGIGFNKYQLFKLHGSVDWYKDADIGLVRCRYGIKYLSDESNILIYPQATKYIETQKDPFSILFNGFRQHLQVSNDNIFISCGYSFGDDHINSEIEMALQFPGNKTNALLFIEEKYDKESKAYSLPGLLKKWLDNPVFNNRIFVISNRGFYNGGQNLIRESGKTDDYNWWTFQGLTEFIS